MNRSQAVMLCSLLVGAVILAVILFMPLYIGMADNGDFPRILSSGGIAPLSDLFTYEQKYFKYAHSQYEYGRFGIDYASSQAIVVFIAGLLGRVWNSSYFDMHVLGALYSIVLLSVLAVFIHAARGRLWLQITLAAGILWVYFDIGYTAYFQSFYGEPVSLLSLLLTIGMAFVIVKQPKPAVWLLYILFAAAWILSTSKLQNAAIGLVITIYCIRMYRLRSDRLWKYTVTGGCILMIVSAGLMYGLGPKELKQINLYQTIFYGILKDTDDPERDLRALGIPERYQVLAGTNYFQNDTAIPQDSPELARDVYSRLGHADIVKYYATHHKRIIDKLQAAARNASFIRPYYLGNYEIEAGMPPGAMSFTYSTWSEGKKQWIPQSLLFYVVFYAMYGIVIGREWFRRRIKRSILEIMLLIAGISIVAAAIPLIGDGEADLGKHLFLFNAAFDMMLIAAGCWFIYVIHYLLGNKR